MLVKEYAKHSYISNNEIQKHSTLIPKVNFVWAYQKLLNNIMTLSSQSFYLDSGYLVCTRAHGYTSPQVETVYFNFSS